MLVVLGISCGKRDVLDRQPMETISALPHKSQYLVVITLDGFRWEDVFRGADSTLMWNKSYVRRDTAWLNQAFWAGDMASRRRKLLPFLWGVVADKGVLYGNRDLGGLVNVTNPFRISYPGYNELFTGYADPTLGSNDYGANPNYNVFEFFKQQPGFGAENVAVFTEWDAFTDILNQPRSGLELMAGAKDGEAVEKDLADSSTERVKKEVGAMGLYNIGDGVDGYDRRVYIAAKSYVIRYHPGVLYVAFGATDTYGHWGRYDSYLENACNVNRMMDDLWGYYQADPEYKGKTTFVITTDHGRGEGKLWTDHGPGIPHSDEIWLAAVGPDTRPEGELTTKYQLYQKQVARTLAAFLGFDVAGVKRMGRRIATLMDSE